MIDREYAVRVCGRIHTITPDEETAQYIALNLRNAGYENVEAVTRTVWHPIEHKNGSEAA